MNILYEDAALEDLASIRDYYQDLTPQGYANILEDIMGLIEDIPTSIAKGRKPIIPISGKINAKIQVSHPLSR